jgi:hypothetical protein
MIGGLVANGNSKRFQKYAYAASSKISTACLFENVWVTGL